MSSPRDAGAAFAAALLDPQAPAPEGLVAWHGGAMTRRFAVYRNNVVSGLIDALAKRFPVCAQIVGDDFFRAMAGVFVRAAPPTSPILAEYGADFAAFIAGFAPAAALAYLPDVARLEFAIGSAFRAADAEPLALDAVAALAPEDYERKGFELHPAMRFTPSSFPIVSIWRAHVGGGDVSAIDLSIGEDAVATRPRLDVEAHALPAGGLAFLQALARGLSLAAAAEAGAGAAADFDLAANLGLLLACGGIVGVIDAKA
jgi:hypothetical protein